MLHDEEHMLGVLTFDAASMHPHALHGLMETAGLSGALAWPDGSPGYIKSCPPSDEAVEFYEAVVGADQETYRALNEGIDELLRWPCLSEEPDIEF